MLLIDILPDFIDCKMYEVYFFAIVLFKSTFAHALLIVRKLLNLALVGKSKC